MIRLERPEGDILAGLLLALRDNIELNSGLCETAAVGNIGVAGLLPPKFDSSSSDVACLSVDVLEGDLCTEISSR